MTDEVRRHLSSASEAVDRLWHRGTVAAQELTRDAGRKLSEGVQAVEQKVDQGVQTVEGAFRPGGAAFEAADRTVNPNREQHPVQAAVMDNLKERGQGVVDGAVGAYDLVARTGERYADIAYSSIHPGEYGAGHKRNQAVGEILTQPMRTAEAFVKGYAHTARRVGEGLMVAADIKGIVSGAGTLSYYATHRSEPGAPAAMKDAASRMTMPFLVRLNDPKLGPELAKAVTDVALDGPQLVADGAAAANLAKVGLGALREAGTAGNAAAANKISPLAVTVSEGASAETRAGTHATGGPGARAAAAGAKAAPGAAHSPTPGADPRIMSDAEIFKVHRDMKEYWARGEEVPKELHKKALDHVEAKIEQNEAGRAARAERGPTAHADAHPRAETRDPRILSDTEHTKLLGQYLEHAERGERFPSDLQRRLSADIQARADQAQAGVDARYGRPGAHLVGDARVDPKARTQLSEGDGAARPPGDAKSPLASTLSPLARTVERAAGNTEPLSRTQPLDKAHIDPLAKTQPVGDGRVDPLGKTQPVSDAKAGAAPGPAEAHASPMAQTLSPLAQSIDRAWQDVRSGGAAGGEAKGGVEGGPDRDSQVGTAAPTERPPAPSRPDAPAKAPERGSGDAVSKAYDRAPTVPVVPPVNQQDNQRPKPESALPAGAPRPEQINPQQKPSEPRRG